VIAVDSETLGYAVLYIEPRAVLFWLRSIVWHPAISTCVVEMFGWFVQERDDGQFPGLGSYLVQQTSPRVLLSGQGP
jgi:hypothetical protein